ncbi:hypothetical protein [Cyclobacterium xiamenense]
MRGPNLSSIISSKSHAYRGLIYRFNRSRITGRQGMLLLACSRLVRLAGK